MVWQQTGCWITVCHWENCSDIFRQYVNLIAEKNWHYFMNEMALWCCYYCWFFCFFLFYLVFIRKYKAKPIIWGLRREHKKKNKNKTIPISKLSNRLNACIKLKNIPSDFIVNEYSIHIFEILHAAGGYLNRIFYTTAKCFCSCKKSALHTNDHICILIR